VSAGQTPDTFWTQTPATYSAVIDGVIERRKYDQDAALVDAYTVASFSAAAQAGKLKPLDFYRRRMRAKSLAQTPNEMLEVFREFQSRGAPMTIRRVERKPD